jgi:hypothetical protein
MLKRFLPSTKSLGSNLPKNRYIKTPHSPSWNLCLRDIMEQYLRMDRQVRAKHILWRAKKVPLS